MDEAINWIKPVQKQSLGEQAYQVLQGALMRGELKPGTVLPLRPVAKSFGISPTPMREAMMRLIAEHALEFDERGRVCVPHISRAVLMEIRSIRERLEGDAAMAAATMASAEAIDELEAIHLAMIEAQNGANFSEAIGCNTQFHLKLCEIAHQPVALTLVSNLWMRCGPLLAHLYDAGIPPNWNPHPHLRIVDALRQKDGAEARTALIFDIRGNGAGLLAHVKDSADALAGRQSPGP